MPCAIAERSALHLKSILRQTLQGRFPIKGMGPQAAVEPEFVRRRNWANTWMCVSAERNSRQVLAIDRLRYCPAEIGGLEPGFLIFRQWRARALGEPHLLRVQRNAGVIRHRRILRFDLIKILRLE